MSKLYDECVNARLHVMACVEENFGSVGNDVRACAAVEKMRELDFKLKTLEPEKWKEYEDAFDL